MSDFLKQASAKTYAEQGQMFLNAFWDEIGAEAQEVYDGAQVIASLDQAKGPEGSSIDEEVARVFLEKMGRTLTAIGLRQLLREMDVTEDKRLSYIEYLMYHFKEVEGADAVTFDNFSTRPQGDNTELYEAQAELKGIQTEMDDRRAKMVALEAKSIDESLSTVKRNRFKHDLDMMRQEDDMPIKRRIAKAESKIKKAAKNGEGNQKGLTFWMEASLETAKKFQKTYIKNLTLEMA